MYVIYKTTNEVNGKIYIGIHKTKNKYDSYLGSGKHLVRAINKYGKENFKKEILFEYEDHEEDMAWAKEKELVNKDFVLSDDNYNISIGGYKPPVMVGKYNPFYGKTHSVEAKLKMSEQRKGQTLTEEHKKKIGEKSKEWWQNEEHKEKWIQTRIGKKKIYTPEGLANLKLALAKRVISQETRDKMSESQRNFHDNMTPEERDEWYERVFTEERSKKISETQKGVPKSWVADKVNRNPEKIRKTAEKHKGMKRTEETRKRISEAKRGKKCIHDPQTGVIRMIPKEQELPEGFVLGRGKGGKKNAETKT